MPPKNTVHELQREISRERSAAETGFFTCKDGTRLFYTTEGKGYPLVFCYGLVSSSLNFSYQIDHFQQSYQTIWYDYRGHGRSQVPKDLKTLTLNQTARDLDHLLEHFKIKEAIFLGHSMGSNVILDFYQLFPEKVRAMVLVSGACSHPLETMLNHNSFQRLFQYFADFYLKHPNLTKAIWGLQRFNPLHKAIVARLGFNMNLTPREDIDHFVEQASRMDPIVLINLLENYDTYNATAWLHTIQKPTLIIAGENDHIIPIAQQELMHQLIPGSQFEIIKHGSHCPQMDLPEFVNLKIELFIRKCLMSKQA